MSATSPTQPPSSPPVLKVFDPADSQPAAAPPGDERLQWSLRRCYEKYIAPKLRSRERTAEAFRNALDWWESLTSDPPISAVDDDAYFDFQSAAAAQPTLKAPTVNKIVRQLDGIFNLMGPRGYRRKSAKNVLTVAPYVEPLVEDAPEKRTVPLTHLAAIYSACRVATWPRIPGLAPAVWWRCLIVFFYCFGLRTKDLRQRQWSDIVQGEEDATGRSRPDVQYLRFVPKKTKRRKPWPLYLPLNPVALLHLGCLPRDRTALFPSPKGTKMFYNTWHAIQDAAGIKRHYTLKSIRVTCNTRLNRVVAEDGRTVRAGKHVLGHGRRGDVNEEFYDQIEDDVYDALMGLACPEELRAGPYFDVARQLSLFE